ncbi:hypothetical protein FACUT_2086 [Fusarium acutatum]|uniref:F-box domain-containing protein n=1 Tax=Fusarium acutatum TaxID=78861 RepID=A0A8H4K4A7_9HYPO|nr:hypothetical protein FACUT_2086 [Fusarium acutatum]
MDSLPDEILHKIFAELEDQMPLDKWQLYESRLNHQGSAALRNLCLACRQSRRIAQPLLYRTIVIESRDGAKNVGTLLLRTFVENPQLAEQVRAASLTDCVKLSEQVEILGKDATKALVRSAMEKLDIPPALRRIMKRHIASSGFAALILAYMPHVQVVDCTIGDKPTILAWLLSASPDAGRPLGWLERDRKVELSDDEDYAKKPEEYDLSDEEERAFPRPEHKNYNLEYFDVMGSYIDAEGLATILTRCPKLKGISIRLPDEERQTPIVYDDLGNDVDEDDCALNFDDFGDVLRKHGQNLEDFDFYTFFF